MNEFVLNIGASVSTLAVLCAAVPDRADHKAAVGLCEHCLDRVLVLLCQRELKNVLVVIWMFRNAQPSTWEGEWERKGRAEVIGRQAGTKIT